MKTAHITSSVLTTAVVSAWEWDAGPYGPCAPGFACSVISPATQKIISSAGRRPNLTSTVSFEMELSDNTIENLEWRVNLTSIPVPNNWTTQESSISPTGNYSQGLSVVSTEWELIWPGQEQTLQQYATEHNFTVSFNFIQASLPPNLLSRFKGVDNQDCRSALGEECIKDLVLMGGQQIPLDTVSSCDSSLDLSNTANGFYLNVTNNPNYPINHGDAIFYQQTAAYPPSNTTLFNQTAGLLQLLVMSEKPQVFGTGIGMDPAVQCQILQQYNASSEAVETSGAVSSFVPSGFGLAITLLSLMLVLLH